MISGCRGGPQRKHRAIFADKFVQLQANYAYGNGAQVIDALVKDADLLTVPLADAKLEGELYRIHDAVSRRETLRTLLVDASIQVTIAMAVADESGYLPVTNDPFFGRLLAMRLTHRSYVQGTSPAAPLLGLEVVKAVIPDQVLQNLNYSAILEYREKTKDAYEAWSVEINKLALELDQLTPDEIQREIPRVITAQVTPRLVEYRHEMESARDKLFGDLIKKVTAWEIPVVSLVYITNLSIPGAIAAFLAGVRAAAPPLVDYFQERRKIGRKHAMTYLIGLTKKAD